MFPGCFAPRTGFSIKSAENGRPVNNTPHCPSEALHSKHMRPTVSPWLPAVLATTRRPSPRDPLILPPPKRVKWIQPALEGSGVLRYISLIMCLKAL